MFNKKNVFYDLFIIYLYTRMYIYWHPKRINSVGSLEGESPQGFLRAQNPKLS